MGSIIHESKFQNPRKIYSGDPNLTKPRVTVFTDTGLLAQSIEYWMEKSELYLMACASDFDALLFNLRDHFPNVVFLSLSNSRLLVESVRSLMSEFDSIRVLVHTMNAETPISELLEMGVNGFISSDASYSDLEMAITQLSIRGHFYQFDLDSLTKVKKKRKTNVYVQHLAKEGITKRELEVLELICLEYTNFEIADKLCVSRRTVEGHRLSLIQKTRARNTAGLVKYAFNNDLIS